MTEIDYKTLNRYLQKEADYSSLYLIYGEDLLVRSALNKLLDVLIPEKQRWWWTEEWQAGEGEVDKALKEGRIKEFDNVDDLIKDLNS